MVDFRDLPQEERDKLLNFTRFFSAGLGALSFGLYSHYMNNNEIQKYKEHTDNQMRIWKEHIENELNRERKIDELKKDMEQFKRRRFIF